MEGNLMDSCSSNVLQCKKPAHVGWFVFFSPLGEIISVREPQNIYELENITSDYIAKVVISKRMKSKFWVNTLFNAFTEKRGSVRYDK